MNQLSTPCITIWRRSAPILLPTATPISSLWAKARPLDDLCHPSKEEKRVSNVPYALCTIFLESHVPGIQKMRTWDSKIFLGMASSASKPRAILSENDRKTIQNKCSSRIYQKLPKIAILFRKSKCLASWLGHVCKTGRLTEELLHRVSMLSSPRALWTLDIGYML